MESSRHKFLLAIVKRHSLIPLRGILARVRDVSTAFVHVGSDVNVLVGLGLDRESVFPTLCTAAILLSKSCVV